MIPSTHDEIVAGLVAGDPAAWRELFQHYAPQVCRFCARRMEGRAAANIHDVVQETMLAAARSAGAYDADRGTLWNWLRGIAQRQIALRYRVEARHDVLVRAKNELSQTNGRLARWLDGSSDLPEEILLQAETSALVRAALFRLPPEYGDLLTAKYIDEQSVEQIATSNGTTITGVQSKLARARKAFRENFDPTN